MSTHLYRSRDDRMLAGVAGGLAERWDADPSLVRIVWALLVVLTGGIALVVYIVMAIVVPDEDDRWSWGGGATHWDERAGSAVSAPATGAAAPPGASSPPLDSASRPAAAEPPSFVGATAAASRRSATSQPSRYDAREMRRAARHEARVARRAARARAPDGRSGAVVVGILFILVGVWYLVREYIPAIDWDWFWPLVLVAVGVLVLVLAVRPRSDASGPADPDGPGGRS